MIKVLKHCAAAGIEGLGMVPSSRLTEKHLWGIHSYSVEKLCEKLYHLKQVSMCMIIKMLREKMDINWLCTSSQA